MRARSRELSAIAVGTLLLLCLAGLFWTRDAAGVRVAARQSGPQPALDQRLLETARQLGAAADTPDEQALSAEAVRLADHEVDQAFATALREAAAATPPASGPLKQLAAQIAQLKAQVAADQARIAQFGKQAPAESSGDDLQLAKAQLALDQDELDDASQDLARQGGDPHATLERALDEHEAAQRAALPKALSAATPGTLAGQLRAWLSLRSRARQLAAAREQAAQHAAGLEREHNALDASLNQPPPPGAATLDRLRRLADQRRTLAEFDKRIQDSRQLADVYLRWDAQAASRRRHLLNLLLRSLAAVLAVLLAMILLDRAIRRAFGNRTDRRRLHQLRVMARIGVQVVAALVIVFIVFGTPSQAPTIIGLVTAGLTVVLKDFIVAFFGWFVLMGRNGIRVGDWVEIEGVSGEVVEIGLLRTVLLEMGNWAGAGHPIGRRVAFVNSFAIEGHYFNFSTSGQWLWDTLQFSLAANGDPYEIAQRIREDVERETEADARLVEQDWERVTRQYGIKPFSARPAVELRPSGSGVDVIVRYITRAPQRDQVKSRLFQLIVALLHKKGRDAFSGTQTSTRGV